jgi:mannose-6-phosphate isomerase-like protein (cupin superfamily)
MVDKVNLVEKLAMFAEPWSPRVIGDVNECAVKLVKLRGEFVWHRHESEDELFLVIKGRFRMELRDGTVPLEEGELIVVPRGVEHRPVADEEAHVLLFEPRTVVNTGNVVEARTVRNPERI